MNSRNFIGDLKMQSDNDEDNDDDDVIEIQRRSYLRLEMKPGRNLPFMAFPMETRNMPTI